MASESIHIVEESPLIRNLSGKIMTNFAEEREFDINFASMRHLHAQFQVPELFNAHFLWEKGFTGF